MIKYTEAEKQEISDALAIEQNISRHKRLQVLLWRMNGMPEKEAGFLSGMDTVTIWRLCSGYKKKGLEVIDYKYKGNNRKLSVEKERYFLGLLSDGANSGKFVRVSELKAEFEALSGVCYEYSAFYTLLRRNQWRKITPRGRHPKAANEETCDAAKKLTPKSTD